MPVNISIIDSILSKIKKDKKTKCWNFTGSNNGKYCRIRRKGKIIYVHRYMYFYFKIKPLGTSWKEFDKNNKDLCVCHRCDNTKCCNPKHLFLGTQSTNIKDCVIKGRHKPSGLKGEKHPGAKLTQKCVDKIRNLLEFGHTQQSIADRFDVGKAAINKIKTGRTWS